MTLPETLRCFHVRKTLRDTIESSVESRPSDELPAGDTVVRVDFSGLNYKDALAATGNPGIVKTFPHVPGIDAAGIVVHSESANLTAGQPVIVTGYQQGAERWGGWSEYIRVPSQWVVPKPDGLTLRESMILGTAGFTAAQCVWSLEQHGVSPDRGPIVVTGATGGVGILAVMLLAKLGYEVTAVSGKTDKYDWLRAHGAADVIGRDAVLDLSDRPLLRGKWAGAVDTVGGATLATILRSLKHRGCVAACGMVGGNDLSITVYPFILRGVTLDGIDSAQCPRDDRLAIWSRLASAWKLDNLDELAREVTLDTVAAAVEQILNGKISGRVLVRPVTSASPR